MTAERLTSCVPYKPMNDNDHLNEVGSRDFGEIAGFAVPLQNRTFGMGYMMYKFSSCSPLFRSSAHAPIISKSPRPEPSRHL